MRLAVVAALVLVAPGCKDKQPQQATSAPSPTTRKGAPLPSLDRPQATGASMVKITKLSATVFYSVDDLQFNGSSLGKLRNGVIDRERIDRLLQLLEAPGATSDPIAVSLAPSLPYLLVAELLFKLKAAGFRNLALMTPGSMPIPLEMIDADQLGTDGLRPVVTLSGGRVILWSASGSEGTQGVPKLTLPSSGSFDALTAALVEIVERRWPDGKRPAADRQIIVQVSGRETSQTLMHVLATVRSEGTLELFPTIYLAGGA